VRTPVLFSISAIGPRRRYSISWCRSTTRFSGSSWPRKAGYSKKTARTGAVTLIQRFGRSGAPAALNLNIHFHMLLLDGVYVERADGDQSDNSADNAGAVYVFTRTAGVWLQQNYVKASNTDAGDLFGGRVALSGDTVAAGARREDSAATGIDGDQSNTTANGAVAVSALIGIPTGNAKLSSLDPNSKEVIPVAVLGSVNFAATQGDFSTAEFGPGQASPVHDGHVENVNDDDFLDVVFHFNTQDTSIACIDTDARLSGETFSGEAFTGTNSVKISDCR